MCSRTVMVMMHPIPGRCVLIEVVCCQVHLLMVFCLLLGTALIYYVWKAKKDEGK